MSWLCHVGTPTTLDNVTAARLKKESPSPNAFKAEEEPSAIAEADDAPITLEEMRAICVSILAGFSNGRSGVRLQVSTFCIASLSFLYDFCSNLFPRQDPLWAHKIWLDDLVWLHGIQQSLYRGRVILILCWRKVHYSVF